MKKVLIPTKLDSLATKILADHGGYEVVQEPKTPILDLAKAHPDAHALIVRSEKVTAEVIDALPRLRAVVRAGAGFDNIDGKYARSKGIDVMNTPGANSNAVAEEVVALILADLRHVVRADETTRRGEWEKAKLMGRELTGKTVGIVGLGHIGRLVAKRISGFECRVLGYDPLVPPEKAKEFGIEPADVETIFRESDFITLHIPQNAETKGFVGKKLLALMKNDATLVNCARAGIVDEDAIREAKGLKAIRFLNDVYPKDAEGPKTVADIADLMMPHLGASTVEANRNAAVRAAEELVDLDEKGVSPFVVNRDMPAGLDASYCDLAFTLARTARAILGADKPLSRIEVSCYGMLEPYAKWLSLSLLNGIWDDINRGSDFKTVVADLEGRGVAFKVRQADATKKYENSMTVDLAAGPATVSVRGTVGEGVKMIARIDEFNHLYWTPTDNAVFFEYDDRPGVIGAIGDALHKADVNIEDMRNPHNPATGRSMALLSTNKPVAPELVAAIAKTISAVKASALAF